MHKLVKLQALPLRARGLRPRAFPRAGGSLRLTKSPVRVSRALQLWRINDTVSGRACTAVSEGEHPCGIGRLSEGTPDQL
jgi:hypothetical protein